MSESKPKKKKEIEPEKPIRIFISDVRTVTGKELVKKLRNEHINKDDPNIILGTTHISSNPNEKVDTPSGVKRIIDASKIELLQKVLLDSDVIIYDINNCDLEEAEFALKTLKTFEYKDPKVFICISSVLTWSATPPKEKKEPEEGQPEEQEEEEEEEPEEEVDEEGSEAEKEEEKAEDDDEPKKVYISFTEKHLAERKCWPKYEPMRSFETLCLAAGQQKPSLRTFVLCSGIPYGLNCPFLFEKLKQAYLQRPPSLTYYSTGKTRIPGIHIQDLCEFAKHIILRKDTLKSPGYMFAVDRNRQNFQKRIVQGISKGVGNGQVISVPLPMDPFKLPSLHPWLLDLRIKPSKMFDPKEGEDEEEQEEEEQEEEEGGEGEAAPKKKKIEKFIWHCQDGIQKNIGKLNNEFQASESLRANRILITGPPGIGKTYYSTLLAHYYNLPLISIKDIAVQGLKIESDFGEELRNAVQEAKDKMVEEEQERLNSIKEKREKVGLPIVEADYEVNPDKIEARIPEEFLMKLLKMRLGQNDCLNRGYVLDGIPRTFKQAELVFKMVKLTEEGEEPDEENAEKIIDPERIPNSVVLLEASDHYLFEKIKRLPEKVVQGTHFNEADMKKRVKKYREVMDNENGAEIITDFFQENQVDLLMLDIQNKENQVVDMAKKFINRNGNFVTYQTFEQEQELEQIQQVKKTVVNVQQLDKQKYQELNEHEQEIRDLVEEEYKLNQEDLRAEERNILEIQSEPLKQYLADNVAEFVTEGILEMCQRKPRDPVDFLAEYLFDKSLHVKFPDPLSYLKIKKYEQEEKQSEVN